MNTANFLKGLIKTRIVQLVENSEDISLSYFNDSKSYIFSAKLLFNEGRFKEATQLSYFSLYYSILGILFKIGIKSENHSASILLLKEVFEIDNQFALKLKEKRVGTYYPDFEIERKSLEQTIKETEDFNSFIFNFVSKLDSGKINFYRSKFNELANKDG